MSIEGLGKKLQEARKSRNLSLEEAARLTRIRQSRLEEIEADDFSNFPSLAYARGFLQIYGKFLGVDVSPYLDVFETSGQITVDGYSYLQDTPAPKAPRTAITRRRENTRPSLVPFFIAMAILVAGFWFLLESTAHCSASGGSRRHARTKSKCGCGYNGCSAGGSG
jgi:cytoskeleton protein RodZ